MSKNQNANYFHKEVKPRNLNPTFLSFSLSLAVHPLEIPTRLSCLDPIQNSSFLPETPKTYKNRQLSTLSSYGNSVLTPIKQNQELKQDKTQKIGTPDLRVHLPKQYLKSVSPSVFQNRFSLDELSTRETYLKKQNLEQNTNFSVYKSPSKSNALRAQYFDELTNLH